MGDPEIDYSKRWKQIRDRYVRELRKTKDVRSGEADPAYISVTNSNLSGTYCEAQKVSSRFVLTHNCHILFQTCLQE